MLKNKPTIPIAIAVFIALSIFAIFGFSAYERNRDIDNWRITLGALADHKAQAVNNWLDTHLTSLMDLAANPYLQMYTQRLDRKKENRTENQDQLSYLRKLIESTAIRAGFTPTNPKQSIKADIALREDQSLALYTSDLTLLASTKGTIPLTENLRIDMANALVHGKPVLLKMVKQIGSAPAISFLVPVYGLQTGAKHKPVGILHGRLSPVTSLFPLLTSQAGGVGKSIETYLIRNDGNLATYISPLKDGEPPLTKQLANNDLTLVAAQAINQPGIFGSGHDYSGEESLFVSRTINHLDWLIIQKISQNEALKESHHHRRILTWTLLVSLLLVLSLINAVWKHGISRRQQQTTAILEQKTAELTKQTILLNSISDNMSDLILLVDKQDNILFINRPFANLIHTTPKATTNKDLKSLIGPDPADKLHQFYAHSREVHRRHLTLHLHKQRYEFLATAVKINYGDTGDQSHLISLHDVTRLKEELRQNEKLLQQTIKALMRAIDQHDPYSANHSAKTAKLVEKLAIAINLSESDRQGIMIAANLCNLGKLSIPKDLLSKTEELGPDEKELLAKESHFAAKILRDVEFSWPVAETIGMKTEFLDGSGTPRGLSGKEISKAGRILAVANSFVAMTSPRPYRKKLSAKESLNQLLELIDTLYDRKVVAALFNIIENESEDKPSN